MLKVIVLLALAATLCYITEVEAGDYKYSIAYNPKGYASYKCPKNYRRTDLDFKNRPHWTLMRWGTKDNPACALRDTRANCHSKDGHKKNWLTFSRGHGEFHISKHEHFSDMRSSSLYYPRYPHYKGGKRWYGGKKRRGYGWYGHRPSSHRYSSNKFWSSYPRSSLPYPRGYWNGYPHSSYSSSGKKRGKGKAGRYYKHHNSYKYPGSHRSSYYSSVGSNGYPHSRGSYYHRPSSGGYGYGSGSYSNSFGNYGYGYDSGSSFGKHHSGSHGYYPSSRKGYKYPASSYPLSYGSSKSSSGSNTAVPVNFSVRALYFKVRGVQEIEIKLNGPVSKTIVIRKGKELDPRKKTWICVQFESFPVFREIWFTFKFSLHKKAKFWDLYLFSCCENLKDKINFD